MSTAVILDGMRLDKYLSENGFSSRNKAARAIEKGLVLLNGKRARAADTVKENDSVTVLKEHESYVSEGGYKLAKALREFGVSVAEKVYADFGASTGGFTDVLLQNGVSLVFAIDVGESQLAPSIACDNRVRVYDNTNARNLTRDFFSVPLDGVVCDVSFISLTCILPAIAAVLKDDGEAFVLIKPQFECGVKALDKHGIVKDGKQRREAVEKIYQSALECGLAPQNICVAPLRERKNIEFIIYLKKGIEPVAKQQILNIKN